MSEYVKCGTNAVIRGGKPGMGALDLTKPSTLIGAGLVAYGIYALLFSKKKR